MVRAWDGHWPRVGILSRPLVVYGAAAALVFACGPNGGTFGGGYECDTGYNPNQGDWEGGCDFCWDGGSVAQPSAILPTFLPTVTASSPPPPISGGTLLVTTDGRYAIAADPDRDLVYGVDLASGGFLYTITLTPGDEPGRVVEDGHGRVHVALRSGGALVTFDEASGAILARRSVCPAPRGVAWDASTDLVWVACATGELVALPSAGGAATKSWVVERDLRDVIVSNGAVSVSKFRSAEILRLASDGTIARRDAQPTMQGVNFTPHVAWRAIQGPSGRVAVVHQLESTAAILTQVSGAYGGCSTTTLPPPPPTAVDAGADAAVTCGDDAFGNFAKVGCDEQPGVVVSALTVLGRDGSVVTSRTFPGTLPVDVAVSRDGTTFAVAAAGDAFTKGVGGVLQFTACGDFSRTPATVGTKFSEQATAVAFGASNNLLVQTREPAELWIFDAKTNASSSITLSTTSRDDTGHDVFHTQAGAMIACASCHPEGQDDSHTWSLDANQRRTPSLRGTVAGTAPYHWPGDEASLAVLVDDVYTKRMNGAPLPSGLKDVLTAWVQTLPAPVAPSWVDPSAAQRGRAIFGSTTVGCSGCHSGAKLTNNQTMNVGTGGSFQVPPLIGVGWRTPLLHDGCAATIADRFGKCATPSHGQIGSLSTANIADLTSYLETL